MIAGYMVVQDTYTNAWIVKQWDSELRTASKTPFGSVWADAKLAQMVADVANVLDAHTLQKYIEVVENL